MKFRINQKPLKIEIGKTYRALYTYKAYWKGIYNFKITAIYNDNCSGQCLNGKVGMEVGIRKIYKKDIICEIK